LAIHARVWKPEKPEACVVVVHGIGDHSGRFQWFAQQLAQQGFAVLAADWRGNGLSDGIKGDVPSFEKLETDLAQTLKQAGSFFSGPTFLYGQSFGGLLVIRYVIRMWQNDSCDLQKVRGIVASSPALGIASKAPAWKLAIAKTLGKLNPRIRLATGIRTRQLTRDQEAQTEFNKDTLRHRKISARTFFGMLEAGDWSIEHASELKTPLLLMHGSDDTVTDHRRSIQFASHNEFANCKIWRGMRHELHHEIDKAEVIRFGVHWMKQQYEPVQLDEVADE